MRQYNHALDIFNDLIAKQPSYGLANYNRGLTKKALEDFTGACADFRKSDELGYANAKLGIASTCK